MAVAGGGARGGVSLCMLAGGETITLAVAAFTLSWSHSVEKTRWEEDWRITPAGLEIAEARIRGSGAGMEPPDGSVLRDGWWRYVPDLSPLPEIVLAASGATEGGWLICARSRCTELGSAAEGPVRLKPCSHG